MKLSAKTLSKLVKGSVYFEEERGYFVPYRYSKEQIDYMAREEYDWGWRMRAAFSGGIRLEFKTDSKNISFDYNNSMITIILYPLIQFFGQKIEEKLFGNKVLRYF